MTAPPSPRRSLAAPFLVLVTSAGLLVGALMFQYVWGLAPCTLCHWQRWPHFAALALAAAALVLPARAGRALTLLAVIGLVTTAGIGVFHVGVEQHWWPGFASCTAAAGSAGDIDALLAQIEATAPVQCDAIPWQMFGISMAGYNVLISAAAALLAVALLSIGQRRAEPPAAAGRNSSQGARI